MTRPRIPADLSAGRYRLGECVLWDLRTQQLYWTDIEACRLHRYSPAAGTSDEWRLPARLACFALCESPGHLLLGLESGLAWLDLASGSCSTPRPVAGARPGTRINDGRCDRSGNFVFGMKNERDRSRCAGFYRLDARGTLQMLDLPQVAIANSICFNRAGSRMYFADSLSGRIQCCDYDAASGAVGEVRDFSGALGAGVEPDGATVDAEDHLWSALWGGRSVVRLRPDGSLERRLDLPVSQPSCVGFGGSTLDTLYISSASEFLSAAAREAEPAAGAVFAQRFETIRGLAEPLFRGRP